MLIYSCIYYFYSLFYLLISFVYTCVILFTQFKVFILLIYLLIHLFCSVFFNILTFKNFLDLCIFTFIYFIDLFIFFLLFYLLQILEGKPPVVGKNGMTCATFRWGMEHTKKKNVFRFKTFFCFFCIVDRILQIVKTFICTKLYHFGYIIFTVLEVMCNSLVVDFLFLFYLNKNTCYFCYFLILKCCE